MMTYTSTSDFRWAVFLTSGTGRTWFPHALSVTISEGLEGTPGSCVLRFPDGFKEYMYYGQEIMVFSGYHGMRAEFTGYLYDFRSSTEAVFMDRSVILDSVQLSLSIRSVSPLDIIYAAVSAALSPKLLPKGDADPWSKVVGSPDAGKITLRTAPDNTTPLYTAQEIDKEVSPSLGKPEFVEESTDALSDAERARLLSGARIFVMDFADIDKVVDDQYVACTVMMARQDPQALEDATFLTNLLYSRAPPKETATSEQYAKFDNRTRQIANAITESLRVELLPLAQGIMQHDGTFVERSIVNGTVLHGPQRLKSPVSFIEQNGKSIIPKPVLSYDFIDRIVASTSPAKRSFGVFIHDVIGKPIKRDAINYYKQTPRQIIRDVISRWKLPWTIGVDALGNLWIGDRRALFPSRFMAIVRHEHIVGQLSEVQRLLNTQYKGTRVEMLGHELVTTPGKAVTTMDLDPAARKYSNHPVIRARQEAEETKKRARAQGKALTNKPAYERVKTYTAQTIPLSGVKPMDVLAIDHQGYVGFGKVVNVDKEYSRDGIGHRITWEPLREGQRYVAIPRDKSK